MESNSMPVAVMDGKTRDVSGPSQQEVLASCIGRIADHKDRDAFSVLFSHFGPRLKSFMIGKGANEELAEDLVQETMVLVWRKAQLYHPDRGSVATWIYTIARNQRIDRLRREANFQFTDIDDFDGVSDDPLSDETVNRSMEDDLVRAALSELPPEQAKILVLSYVEDIPQSEIAEKLDLPLGTVKSRMRLAYGRLRKSLEQLR